MLVPHLYAGPSAGFNVNCSIDVRGSGIPNTSSDCERQNFKPRSLDWNAVVGGGIDLSLAGFSVTAGARYGVGVTKITEDDADALRNRARTGTLAVYAGFRVFGR